MFSDKKLIVVIKALCIAALISPLLVTLKTSIFPFVVPKVLFFCIVVELASLVYLILIWKNKNYLPARNSIVYSAIAFMVAVILSAVFGVDWQNSWWGNFERMEGVFTVLHCFIYFLILFSVFRFKKDWIHLFSFLLFVCIAVIFSGIVQYFIPQGKTFLTLGGGGRVFGTLGNFIYFGQFSFFTFWLAALLMTQYQRKYRWFCVVVMILSVFGIYLAHSRGPLVAWLASIIFFGFISFWKIRQTKYRFAILFGVVGLAVFLLLAMFFPNSITNSVPIVSGLQEVSTRSGTADTRLMAWGIAWQGFLERPILGWGWFNYYVVFNKFYRPEFLEHGFAETWFDHAHNQYFDMLAMTGIVGAVAYLSIFCCLFYLLFRMYRRDKERKLVMICASLLVGHLVNNIFVFEHPSSFIIFFIIVAYVAFLHQSLLVASVADSLKERRLEMSNIGKASVAVLGALVIYFLFGGSLSMWKANRADRDLLVAFPNNPLIVVKEMDKVVAKGGPSVKDLRNSFAKIVAYVEREPTDSSNLPAYKEVMRVGTRWLEDNARDFPLNTMVQLSLAQMYKDLLFVGDDVGERMEQIFQNLAKLSPRRQQVYYYWAELKLVKGEYQEAVNLVRKTIIDDPDIYHGYWLLAKIDGATGRWDSAYKYLNLAQKRGFVPDAEQKGLVDLILTNAGK